MRRERVSDAAEVPEQEIDLEHMEHYGGPELSVEELNGDKVIYNSKFFKKEYKLKRIAICGISTDYKSFHWNF